MPQISHVPPQDVASHLSKLIELRAITYRTSPYLYEQNLEDEKEYVVQYVDTDQTLLVLARKDLEILGMAIGLPLSASQNWIKEAFTKYSGSLEEIFYIGDIVTSSEDSELKTNLLNKIESILRREQKFKKIAICEVYREESPEENARIDTFWKGHGYQKQEDIKSLFWWKDLDKEEKTPKTLVYWIKQI